MMLYLRKTGRQSELLEGRFIDDPTAPEPVVELDSGLRMLLSVAMKDLVVLWASDEEKAVLKKHGHRPGENKPN